MNKFLEIAKNIHLNNHNEVKHSKNTLLTSVHYYFKIKKHK